MGERFCFNYFHVRKLQMEAMEEYRAKNLTEHVEGMGTEFSIVQKMVVDVKTLHVFA